MMAYRRRGFEGEIRHEMVKYGLSRESGTFRLSFRSAAEMGEEEYFRIEAEIAGKPCVEVRDDCETSRRMWIVDAGRDWLVGHEGGQPVGIVRTALEHEATGVIDNLCVRPERRGQGYGLECLQRGLATLAGGTDVCRLDVDESNRAARRLYEKAGFQVLHCHAGLEAQSR